MRPYDVLFLFELLQNQWKTPEALKELEDRRLRQLIRHAYHRVPFYRRLFDTAGVRPGDIAGVQDLPKLPVTRREDLANSLPEEILAQGIDARRCRRSVTSGSTGVPLTIFHRRQDLTKMNLAWGRAYFAHGLKPWQRMMDFSGQKVVSGNRPWYQHLGLLRRRSLSTWDDPSKWIAELRRWQPQALSGYVMTLKLLAQAMQAQDVKDFRPTVVFQSSGFLDETSRGFLQSIFGSKIVDIYGSAEGGCIAWECEICSGYHVSSDTVVVELLVDGQPVSAGHQGEIVITSLHSYAMPFIRYRQGDVGTWADGSVRCGRGFPTLKSIDGRRADFVTLPTGKRLSPHHFFIAMDTVAGISEWRLVQETLHRLHAEVVLSQETADGTCDVIRANLKAIVGDEMDIVVSQVPAFAHDPANKLRRVRSLVSESG